MKLKQKLDDYVKQYETEDFIKNDPIQFCHRFESAEDKELAGFISSMFAFGNRRMFIKKLNELFYLCENEPVNFIKNFDYKILNGFNYRFAKERDVAIVLESLKRLYNNGLVVKNIFEKGYENCDYQQMLCYVTKYFYDEFEKFSKKYECDTKGACYLLPNAFKGGAMKRVNMFLRWVVRDGSVDLGLWNFIPKSDLLIPLDVHVARVSRKLGLLKRNSNDMKAVIELTENLKIFDKDDPVKYDFALFGYGVNN